MKKDQSSEKTRVNSAPKLKSSDQVVFELWVRAGGRCEFHGCSKDLLEDALTTHTAKLGDVAHIVARSEDGPRGNDPMPLSERNLVSNLMLACKTHHSLIDNNALVSNFPKQLLRKYKLEHEQRIKRLTAFGPEIETGIIRLIGKIRGDSIAVSAEQVRQTVLENAGKYPVYFGPNESIEIDLASLPDEDGKHYWTVGKQKIDEVILHQIVPAIENKKIKHISLFALARIPFLAHFGFSIGDKIPMNLYQKHKNGTEGWLWEENFQDISFSTRTLHVGEDPQKVALILSLSGNVNINAIPEDIVKSHTVFEMRPSSIEPHRSLISSKEHLESFRSAYQKMLRIIETKHPDAKCIHFFPAIPAPVAVICGRELLKEISPSLLCYEFIDGKYNLSTQIN